VDEVFGPHNATVPSKVVLVPLPPAVGRAIDQATAGRAQGPILLNNRGARMERHAATRRLRSLAEAAGVKIGRTHPHMLRHTFVTTMLDAGVDLRDVQIAARHADPRTTMRYDRARKNLDGGVLGGVSPLRRGPQGWVLLDGRVEKVGHSR
jgi:integrase/recombinase XerD